MNATERTEIPRSKMLALISNWRQIARRKFSDAEKSDRMERRFIEHGAMCYFNAAMDLEDVLLPKQSASELLLLSCNLPHRNSSAR
jgi:hypothetical protein